MWRPHAFWCSVKSAFRRDNEPPYLNDTSGFDLSDETAEEEPPRFNKLRVLVADEAPAANGGHTALSVDDESLLDRNPLQTSSEHCENCNKEREKRKQSKVKRRLGLAAILYFLFMVGELVGGYVANSLAIMTDALHMLSDLSSIILTLLALWLSAKSPTKRFTFGFHRFEVLSAIISVLMVYILTGFLLYEAIQRTINTEYNINGDVMLITAAVGVAVNLIMGFLLNQTGHPHSHSHGPATDSLPSSHGHSHGSLAVRAAFVHALGDLAQSVGVLIAAYIIRFKPEYKIADPICTYIFSGLVFVTTLKLLRDTSLIILEGAPKHLNVDQIKEDLMKIDDVYSVEDINVWLLTTGKSSAIIRLQLNPDSSSKWEEVQNKARHLLLNRYRIYKCFIQMQSFRQEENTCANCASA
ncbi:probable proton-coupled zinc antiporter SLC30A4 [Bombina bombina]|uniref:probable proton-coupled zinc antiporter SLC30A4 n=1 Tax=Bombina bombina TaxID=8345 RepID=UPI00235AAE3B|nr:probable proton-coupled zinc antiporter SLC30A4 [Bombina bombina]